jgi:hypothetical protein
MNFNNITLEEYALSAGTVSPLWGGDNGKIGMPNLEDLSGYFKDDFDFSIYPIGRNADSFNCALPIVIYRTRFGSVPFLLCKQDIAGKMGYSFRE